jgi:omega-amidase
MKLRVILVYDPATLQESLPPADLVVLPELMDGGYAALRRGKGIHTPDDRFLNQFRAMSRSMGCTCIAGSVPIPGKSGTMTNTALVFRNGRHVHRYDKIHLFGPGGELRLFRRGNANKVFAVSAGRSRVRGGVIICYDLRFPELVRLLASDGLQILCVPARWPVERDEAWQALLKARAIENQIFVVGCNAQGKEGGFSYVFDPLGGLVMSSRDDPAARFHEVTLDLERIREAHALHRNLRDAVLLRAIRRGVRGAGNSRLATVWIPPRMR